MGRIKIILKKKKVPAPKLNNRLTCELCENIHIHYRNIRVEFTKEEFLHILRLLHNIDINEVENFHYSDWAYKEIIKDFGLPEKTFYNNRLQIEQQMEGHYHIHYRNVRLEFDDLQDIGFSKSFGWYKKCKYNLKMLMHNVSMYIIKCSHTAKKMSVLSNLKIKFDKDFISKNNDLYFYTYKKTVMKLKNLKCSLLTKDGWHTYKLKDSPEYKFLQGDQQAYIDYCDYKNPRVNGEIHSVQRFNNLLASLEANGFDKDSYILVNQDNIIIDGKHRACWLLHKYGKHKKIKVLKIYMQPKILSKHKNFVCSEKRSFLSKQHSTDELKEYSFISFNCPQLSQNIKFQIYYTQNSDEPFSEDNSMIIDTNKHKKDTNNLSVGIYADILSKLRIDAGVSGDIITISDITINNTNQNLKLDITKFVPANMDVLEQTNNSITFKPTSDDPQLVYKLQ